MKRSTFLVAVGAALALGGCSDPKQISDLRAQVVEARIETADANRKADALSERVIDLENRVQALESDDDGQDSEPSASIHPADSPRGSRKAVATGVAQDRNSRIIRPTDSGGGRTPLPMSGSAD